MNRPRNKGVFLLLETDYYVKTKKRLFAPANRQLTAICATIERFSEVAMLEAQEKEVINQGMLTLWVIWAAMLGSLFIYIFICHQPRVGFKSAEGSDLPLGLLRNILIGTSAVALLIAYFIRRFTLSTRKSVSKSKPVERMVRWNAPPFLAKYTTSVIVSVALSESIGIYGFVLFLLGDTFQTLYTFMIVSALAMIFFRPKREELEQLAMAYNKRG